jgi:hypothetical protein
VWSAPSTDKPRLPLAVLALVSGLVLIVGAGGATARSWSSLNELTARSGFGRADLTPPSTPPGLTLTRVTRTTLSVSWQPSRDNRRLKGYRLYRAGSFVADSPRTSATFRGLACGTTHTLGVAALDAAGNRSDIASLSASTSSCSDTAPTTEPANVTATGAKSAKISQPVTATQTAASSTKASRPAPAPAPTPPAPTPPAPTPPPPTQSPTPSAAPAAELGVFRGSGNRAGVQAFGAWLGRQPTFAIDFLPGWSGVDDPSWWVNSWGGRYQVVYSIQLVPPSGGSLQEGASGAYNSHFAMLARKLVELGDADAILRLGWEFNGEWMRWNTGSDPAAYAAYWRQVVNTMRSIPGQRFKFDWCAAFGRAVPDAAYPGDNYVDFIGLDVYDPAPWYSPDPATRWNQMLTTSGGLNWHRDFARRHGKQMSFPEWGLWGVDNPYFIERMHEWIRQNNVAYHGYFDVDADSQHSLARFPQSSARYRALFGAAG